MMNCWHCGPNVQLIWGADFSGEDYCNDEISIVSNLSCPKCGSYVEVYLPKDEYRPDFAVEMIKSNLAEEESIDTAPCSVESDDIPVCDI